MSSRFWCYYEGVLLRELKHDTHRLQSRDKQISLMRFFKTDKGEHGEGDKFLGLVSAQIADLTKKYSALSLSECVKLLHSQYHEERMLALRILVSKFNKSKLEIERKKIFDIFVKNTKYINSWDLVDANVEHVIGEYLYDKKKDLLYTFANSSLVWERRISIIATFNYIKRGEYKETLKIAQILLTDNHDLIHKAVGWMLREVGKRCDEQILTHFLDQHATMMPRTMLRYSIERLPKDKFYYYLRLK